MEMHTDVVTHGQDVTEGGVAKVSETQETHQRRAFERHLSNFYTVSKRGWCD